MPSSQEGYALFLDFDGTLVDIAPTPDAVFVSDELRETLVRLQQRLSGALALISGRQISVLDRHFAPATFDAGGLHGLEVRTNGKMLERPHTARERLQWIADRLQKPLVAWPGALIEDKTHSIAVHWRLAPEAGPTITALLDELAVALGPDFRIQRGKAVAEFLPAHADKGGAIEAFLELAPFKGRKPIFFGDDVTDEDGFRIVNAHGGYSVNVGQPKSSATFRLADARAVRALLMRWARDFPEDLVADLKGES
jgi:trehalose 6-phosphate phosphatase